MEELIKDVQRWGKEKGIHKESTAIAQLNGAIGELYEFREAVIKEKPISDKMTELGDVIVFLINAHHIMHGNCDDLMGDLDSAVANNFMTTVESVFEIHIIQAADYMINDRVLEYCDCLVGFANYLDVDIEDCLRMAVNKITKRSGEMKNGKFVKSEDL